jgi:phage shock protein A
LSEANDEIARLRADEARNTTALSEALTQQERLTASAEAALTKARRVLTHACARYDDWYRGGDVNYAASLAYDLVSAIRAVLAQEEEA